MSENSKTFVAACIAIVLLIVILGGIFSPEWKKEYIKTLDRDVKP